MNRLLMTFFLLFGLVAPAASLAADADQVAYLNLQVIVAESKMGKQAREQFDKAKERMEGEVRAKIKELESLNAELQTERQNIAIDEKKIAAVIERLQQKNKEYERLVADVKEELARKDQELVRQILERVAPILAELATTRGYAMIYKNSTDLAYVAPSADITGEVIARLDKQKPSTGK